MKKALLVIILIFCFINYVKAETFYGKYRLVEDYGEYKDDLLKIDKVKLYNTYKNIYVDMGYMLDNDEYIKDEKDYIEEYVDINENDIGDEYIKIKTINKDSYFIQFRNFKSNMKIYEVEIYYKDKKMSYGFINNPSSKLFNITDNDHSTYIDCDEISNFYINLYNYYNSKDISIKIYTDDNIDYNFLLAFGNYSTYITLHNNNKNKHIISFDNENNTTKYEFKGFKKLYRYYDEEKEVLNYYVENGDNLLSNDYIEFDIYYIRDKIVLNDIMIITNPNEKVEDFIDYSSSKVDINCNIDYKVNGNYLCKFKLNDILVDRNIVVNIPKKNESVEYKEKNNNEINIVIDDYIKNNELNKISNIIDDNNIIVKEINNKKEKAKLNVNTHKNNLIKYIKYIIIVNLIIIEIILFIKKKKK